MKKRLLLLIVFTFLFSLFDVTTIQASVVTCPYSSTQAKVRIQESSTWKDSLSVKCGQVVDLGGFHNNASTLANNVTLRLLGEGMDDYYRNGTGAVFTKAGIYTLKVVTNNYPQTSSCVDSATITVSCPTSQAVKGISTAQCQYSSTQARVQPDISQPWKQSYTIDQGQRFNVGSFHNGTGQFASDTTLTVTGPNYSATFVNGQQVKTLNPGTYTLKVTTNGRTGSACEETATVIVRRVSATCSYSSTQARVQKNTSDPWKSSVDVLCGESFNVGSFHNETGQFATDTTLKVDGPNFTGFFSNGQSIKAYDAGNYTLTVTTNNQSGSACTQQATVRVTCPTPTNTPTPTPTPTQQAGCSYSSTQARVQKDINDPWKSYVEVSCFESFNVGSFHNQTGQFAGDTDIHVRGPFIDWHFNNADRIPVAFPGFYDVTVTTNNQSGATCTDTAYVKVYCSLPWMRGI